MPLADSFGLDYPIIQYADDTLLIMPACTEQLRRLKILLDKFSSSTGLKVNYCKSSLIPINLDHEKSSDLAQVIGCKVESLPFTYLGLPLGTTRPKMGDLIGILHRIDRRLIGIADTLSYDGRLVVIKYIISAIPNFSMCTLKLPLGFLDYIEGSTRGFFWRGKDIHQKGKCLVKWENVCKPKRVGGLGVLNLGKHNISLLMKHLFKFMNREDLPWVKLIWQAHYTHDKLPQNTGSVGSFWWKDCITILNTFLEIDACTPGDGGTIRLWLDQWTDEMLRYKLPHLCSFAKSQSISLKQAVAICVDEDIADMFHIPLSVVADQQCDQLETLLATSTELNIVG